MPRLPDCLCNNNYLYHSSLPADPLLETNNWARNTAVILFRQSKEMERKRLLAEEEKKAKKEAASKVKTQPDGDKGKKQKDDVLQGTNNMDWLNDNISREGLDVEMERLRRLDMIDDDDDDVDVDQATADDDDSDKGSNILVLEDCDAPTTLMDEDTRKATFQAMYSKEMSRQAALLHLRQEHLSSPPKGPSTAGSTTPESEILWEEG